jgi:ABC-2 type transport system permease protein
LLSRTHIAVVPEEAKVQTWRWRQLHGSLVILKKNARLYYLKPPVLIFGVLFPVFFFLAFKMGRPITAESVVPGMVTMAL